MKIKRIGTYVWLMFVFSILFSCVEEQDFNQYDDLSITPTYEASVLYLEVPESTINDLPAPDTYSREFEFEAFSETVFADRVLEGVLTYYVENTTSKPLELEIRFLDATGNVLATEVFELDPEPSAEVIRETYYGPYGEDIDIIRNISSISVTATNNGDNVSTSSQDNPMVSLKSSGAFTVSIK